ncbi:T9SS type A sorting domain-containing protein [Hymenobacter sp. BT491]|nr:T9SS type A sorting domain-containing protein [Hymenobacter sp. BT491]MBC6991569.1 T9SS type A sorting domain-containing protein [Hymenobacter sp. BT491]
MTPNDALTAIFQAAGPVGTDPASIASDTEALPVDLARFEVTAARYDALLSWAIAPEKSRAHFEVERSLDGRNFKPVVSVAGRGATSVAANYAYRDMGVSNLSHRPIYYRLREVAADGKVEYSPVRVVLFDADAKGDIDLYPNPAKAHSTLDLSGLPVGDYTVQLVDLTGRVVQQRTLAGAQRHPLDLQSLPPSTYMVLVRGGSITLSLPLAHD